MTNKTKAIVMANKALRAENVRLWEENDALQRGLDEMKLLYELTIKQLVMHKADSIGNDPIFFDFRVKLPKVDEKEKAELDRYVLTAKAEDDGMELRVVADKLLEEENRTEEDDDEPERQD